jgi:hypothetical protein
MKRLFAVLLMFFASFAVAHSKPSLLSVRKIYVEKMDNNLDSYLISEISNEFHGNMTVVLDGGQADAILRQVPLGAQNTATRTVELVDPAGKELLWSGTSGDREAKFLAMKHGGEQPIAERPVAQMKKGMQP